MNRKGLFLIHSTLFRISNLVHVLRVLGGFVQHETKGSDYQEITSSRRLQNALRDLAIETNTSTRNRVVTNGYEPRQ